MTIENKLGECKHIVVIYQGRMKSETIKEVYYDLANCKRCHSAITLDNNYREISKNIYVKIKR